MLLSSNGSLACRTEPCFLGLWVQTAASPAMVERMALAVFDRRVLPHFPGARVGHPPSSPGETWQAAFHWAGLKSPER
jgi:hypothetical protein